MYTSLGIGLNSSLYFFWPILSFLAGTFNPFYSSSLSTAWKKWLHCDRLTDPPFSPTNRPTLLTVSSFLFLVNSVMDCILVRSHHKTMLPMSLLISALLNTIDSQCRGSQPRFFLDFFPPSLDQSCHSFQVIHICPVPLFSFLCDWLSLYSLLSINIIHGSFLS